MLRSRQELIIQSDVFAPVLYVGELRMINLPKRKFNCTSWIIGEPFPEFCVDSIRYAFENLLVNKVITCHTEIENKSSPVIQTIVDDYFTVSRDSSRELGFIENEILRRISTGSFVQAKDLIHRVIDSSLNESTYTNPWKEFITAVIQENRVNGWKFDIKDSWFRSTVEILVHPLKEEQFRSKLDAVTENILKERKSNKDFSDLSIRLLHHIENKFDEKHE